MTWSRGRFVRGDVASLDGLFWRAARITGAAGRSCVGDHAAVDVDHLACNEVTGVGGKIHHEAG